MTLRSDLTSPRLINPWTDSYFSPVPWSLWKDLWWGHPCPQLLLIIFKDSEQNIQHNSGIWFCKKVRLFWNTTSICEAKLHHLTHWLLSKRAATVEQLSSHWKIQIKQATQTKFEMYRFHFNQHQSVGWNNDIRFKLSHFSNPKTSPLTLTFGHLTFLTSCMARVAFSP